MAFPSIAASMWAGEAATTSSDWTPSLAGLGTINSGDLLVAVMACGVGAQRNFADPSGWTRILYQFGNSAYELYVWAKIAAGSDSLVVAKGGAGSAGVITAHRITGHFGSPVAASITGTGKQSFGSPTDPPSHTASWGVEDNLWFTVSANSSMTSISSYPTNYTLGQVAAVISGVTPLLGVACRNLNAAVEDPVAFSVPGATFGQLATLSVRPSGGGGGSTLPVKFAQLMRL